MGGSIFQDRNEFPIYQMLHFKQSNASPNLIQRFVSKLIQSPILNKPEPNSQGAGLLTSEDYHGDDDQGVATAFAQSESNALIRPKYVRRQDHSGEYMAGGEGRGKSGGGGEGQELSFWIRVGVAISRLLEGEGAVFALCRKCRRTNKGKVRLCVDGLSCMCVCARNSRVAVWAPLTSPRIRRTNRNASLLSRWRC